MQQKCYPARCKLPLQAELSPETYGCCGFLTVILYENHEYYFFFNAVEQSPRKGSFYHLLPFLSLNKKKLLAKNCCFEGSCFVQPATLTDLSQDLLKSFLPFREVGGNKWALSADALDQPSRNKCWQETGEA